MALVTINGKEMQVDDGMLLLDAARGAGFEIPTFCYHAKLSKLGSCRMCLVEIEGMRKLQPSCVTPVMDGMKVFTESPTVVKARKAQMEFLLINHPLDCPVCDQAGECDLQDLSFAFGSSAGRFRWKKRTFEKRDMGPSLEKEMNRCIACRRCSRYCSEISGDYAISELNRGNELEMGSFCHTPIDSEFVGNTAQICPVGALTSKPFKFKARSWDLIKTETICPHCSVGCSITSESKYIDPFATQMLHTQSVGKTEALEKTEVKVLRNNATVDKAHTEISLCARGRYGYQFINSPERIRTPLIKESGKFVEVSWEKAISVVASKLSNIKEREGGQAIGGLTSGICSNEDNYVFQKFLRVAAGTNNIDMCRSGDFDRKTTILLSSMRGNIKVMKNSDAILILGSSVGTDTPIASMNAGIAARVNGAELTMISSGENRLLPSGPTHLVCRKGSENLIVLALIKAIIKEKLYVDAFNGERSKELKVLTSSVKGLNIKKIEDQTGLTEADIITLARSLAGASRGCILFGNDVVSTHLAVETVKAIYNLSQLLGFNGEKGQTIYASTSGNFAGAVDMGVGPDFLPGHLRIDDKDAIKNLSEIWGCDLPKDKGRNWDEMLESIAAYRLKAIYIMGDNPAATAFNLDKVKVALEKLDFLVVQDLFMTDTAKLADVVLPAASYAEKDGTVTNLAGRIQTLNRSITPLNGTKVDWKILNEIAAKMVNNFGCSDLMAITSEIGEVLPSYGAAFNEGIGRDGKILPAVVPDDVCLREVSIPEVPTGAELKGGSPLFVVPGKDVYLASSLSWMDDGLSTLTQKGSIVISAEEGAMLGIATGNNVALETKNGSVTSVAVVSERVPAGTVVVLINHRDFDARPLFDRTGGAVGGRLTKKA